MIVTTKNDEIALRSVHMSTFDSGVFVGKFYRNTELGETLNLLDEVKKGISGINGSITVVLIVHNPYSESRVVDAFSVLDELMKRTCKPDFMAYRIEAEAFRFMDSVVDVKVVLKTKGKLGVAPRANDSYLFIFAPIFKRLI
ncbi:hypothetical protein U1Q18_014678 [Sarracenia purpurea var. burkii]